MFMIQYRTRGSVTAAHQAHNLKAVGSTPTPATAHHTVHRYRHFSFVKIVFGKSFSNPHQKLKTHPEKNSLFQLK